MYKIPQSYRDNKPILGSAMTFQANKAKSAMNISVNSAEKTPRRLSISDTTRTAETSQQNLKTVPRNFKFGLAQPNEVKKVYLKNSDKTIKPPEKPLKQKETLTRSFLPVRQKTSTLLHSCAGISNSVADAAYAIASNRKRSLTYDNLNNKNQLSTTPSQTRVDSKSIAELERRLENLQTIFMNKLNIVKDREPGIIKNEYKFIALLVGNEAKIMIKEDDAKCLPNFIPARSLEDLNVKISKFFTGCLFSFTDKLRTYQNDNRPINCDEIFKELKTEEQDFCAILKDWVAEMCNDGDLTLISDIKQEEIEPLSECSVQTEIGLLENFFKVNNIHAESFDDSKQKLEKEAEIKKLTEEYETKIDDVKKLLLIEQSITSSKEEEIKKLLELNESLSQQLRAEQQRTEVQTKQIVELSSRLQNENDLTFELKKTMEEFNRLREENNELIDTKANFLKKLHQRSTRIDLLEKETQQQKLKMNLQNQELIDLKQRFEEKVKECCEQKSSLEARNQLIDHLRNAVEIEQRKTQKYETYLNTMPDNYVATDGATVESPPQQKHHENKSTSKRLRHILPKDHNSLQIEEFNIIKGFNEKLLLKDFEDKSRNPFALNLKQNDSDDDNGPPEERSARGFNERRQRKRRADRNMKMEYKRL